MEPEKAPPRGDATSTHFTDRIIRAPQHAAGTEKLQRGGKGFRLADRGSIDDHVVQIDEAVKSVASVAVIETATDVSEDQSSLGIGPAEASDGLLVGLIFHRAVAHDMQEHDALDFVEDFPHPVGGIFLDCRVHRVFAPRVAVVDLDPAEESAPQGLSDGFSIVVRCDQHEACRVLLLDRRPKC